MSVVQLYLRDDLTPYYAFTVLTHPDCIRSLWRWNKPLCDEPDLWGWNSLHYAVKLGLADVVSDMLAWKKSLVYLPAGSENAWTTAIHIAASEGDVNMIIELLNHCPDGRDILNSNNQNALHVAVLNNQDKFKDYAKRKKDLHALTNLQILSILDAALKHQEKLVEDLCSIGRFGKRDFEVKRKYEYVPNPNAETGKGVKVQLREDDQDKAKKADQTVIESIMKSAQIHVVVATLIKIVTFAVDSSRFHQNKKAVEKFYDLAGIFQCLSMLAVVIAFATDICDESKMKNRET
ncbi:putative ankyrin repeat-containing protein-like isoform 2 [Capsicum annuum]|nr:putative ankyrin repeat-containing protein-like isoform 2 [Capsicum annuum]